MGCSLKTPDRIGQFRAVLLPEFTFCWRVRVQTGLNTFQRRFHTPLLDMTKPSKVSVQVNIGL